MPPAPNAEAAPARGAATAVVSNGDTAANEAVASRGTWSEEEQERETALEPVKRRYPRAEDGEGTTSAPDGYHSVVGTLGVNEDDGGCGGAADGAADLGRGVDVSPRKQPRKREVRASKAASRRRSTLSPWELDSLILGGVGATPGR